MTSIGDTQLAAARAEATVQAIPDIVLGDSHFLSTTNPTATADQRDMEALGLQLLKMPIIVQAKESAARRWKMMCTREVPAEAWVNFDEKMEEWAFHYLMLAVNGDSNYPKVLDHGYGPPHEWFGMKVPGCRGPGTAENVDNNYSFIPIDGRFRFELHCKLASNPVGECPFHVVGNTSMGMNLAILDWDDVEINPDGTFCHYHRPRASQWAAQSPANGDQRALYLRPRQPDRLAPEPACNSRSPDRPADRSAADDRSNCRTRREIHHRRHIGKLSGSTAWSPVSISTPSHSRKRRRFSVAWRSRSLPAVT